MCTARPIHSLLAYLRSTDRKDSHFSHNVAPPHAAGASVLRSEMGPHASSTTAAAAHGYALTRADADAGCSWTSGERQHAPQRRWAALPSAFGVLRLPASERTVTAALVYVPNSLV